MGHDLSKRKKDKDLHLPGSGLTFLSSQLSFLNYHFSDQLANVSGELKCDPSTNTTSLVERLIQRLICGVGALDPRFSSKFIINLDPSRAYSKAGSQSFSYLVRLDNLSSPLLYPDHQEQPSCHVVQSEGGPQGYTRVRLTGCHVEDWAEFINNHGFLRRDKLQERFVELLAQSAARSSVPAAPEQVDESRLCGCPGKVLDPMQAFFLTQTAPQEQFYLGAAKSHRHSFPDPREFRLAIVEGSPCVRLRVGLLPPLCFSTLEEDIQVTLTLGIGFTGWPHSSDFPSRISLTHIDTLLYQQAATMGFYVVPAPPPPTTRCEDRSSAWQLRFPAAESALLAHYATHSAPARVLSVLRNTVSDLRRTTNGGQVLSDYMLKTFLWFRLEEDHESLVATLRAWDHDKLATHVLVILDQLTTALRTQRHRSYWFPWFNVMLSASGGGTQHYTEEDYNHDAQLLVTLLCRLHEYSQQPLPPTVEALHPWQMLDSKLIGKWQDVLRSLAPPLTTRSRRLGFVPGATYCSAATSQYSVRQLEYIRLMLRGMLEVRALTLYQGQNFPDLFQPFNDISTSSYNTSETSEDLIYLLTSIIDQAKALQLAKKSRYTKVKRSSKAYPRSVSKRESIRSGKRTDSFEAAVINLMDEVRKDSSSSDLSIDSVLVKEVLKWLYYGMDSDRRHLSPVLRPFLNRLFANSHENCWHIEEWKRRQDNQELFALGRFARLVVEEGLSPRDGISDAIQKGWQWAERVIDTASQMPEGVELVFTPSPGRVLRYRVRLHQPSPGNTTPYSTRSLGRNFSLGKADTRHKFATLPKHADGIKELLQSRQEAEDSVPDSAHCRLRAANPIASAIDAHCRHGTHRGIGSIVEALVTLNKFSVLQEVSNLLPEDERAQVLDDIQRVSRERRRRGRRPAAVHHVGMIGTQLYRPVADAEYRESAAADDSNTSQWLISNTETSGIHSSQSLIGSCREARQRQGQSSVYSQSFLEPSLPVPVNPLGQPLLRLTADNRLTLSTKHTPVARANHKKEMVTKL